MESYEVRDASGRGATVHIDGRRARALDLISTLQVANLLDPDRHHGAFVLDLDRGTGAVIGVSEAGSGVRLLAVQQRF